MKILLVDDDTGFLDQAKIFLERCDGEYNVHTCETAVESLKKLKKEDFDIIVSDYMMPVMGGLELLERIRKRGNDIPFIMFTGKGREEIAMDALNLGADRYIQKGGDPTSQYEVLAREIRQEVELYRTKKRLREREELYRVVTESFYDMITLVDIKKNTILLISEAVETLLGYHPEELTGKYFFDLLHPKDRDDVYKQLRGMIETGNTEGMFIDRILCKDGSHKWIENRFRVMPDRDSRPDKLLIVSRDITHSEKVDAQLANMAKRYKNIFDNDWMAILVVDANFTITFANRKFEDMSGYKKDEIVSTKKLTEFIPEDHMPEISESLEGQRKGSRRISKVYETRLKVRDGKSRDVVVSVENINGTDKCIYTLMDLTR